MRCWCVPLQYFEDGPCPRRFLVILLWKPTTILKTKKTYTARIFDFEYLLLTTCIYNFTFYKTVSLTAFFYKFDASRYNILKTDHIHNVFLVILVFANQFLDFIKPSRHPRFFDNFEAAPAPVLCESGWLTHRVRYINEARGALFYRLLTAFV